MQFPLLSPVWPCEAIAPEQDVSVVPPASDTQMSSAIVRAQRVAYGRDLPKRQHCNRTAGSETMRLRGYAFITVSAYCDMADCALCIVQIAVCFSVLGLCMPAGCLILRSERQADGTMDLPTATPTPVLPTVAQLRCCMATREAHRRRGTTTSVARVHCYLAMQ